MLGIPGLCPRRAIDPTWLTSALYQIFPTTIKQLWLADDAVITAGYVSSWPSRIGGVTSVQNGTPKITSASVNGRLILTQGVNAIAGSLDTVNATAPASVIATAICTLPAVGDYALFFLNQVTGGRRVLGGNTGTSTWFSNGTPHYCNGIASETISSRWAVYEATNGASLLGYQFFGSPGSSAALNYIGSCGMILALSTSPTTNQRTQYVGLVRSYYGW
jgi:hypothetical protein